MIEVRIPVLSASKENTVNRGKDICGLFFRFHLWQKNGNCAVALKRLSEATVITSNGIFLPGNSDNGAFGNGLYHDLCN